MNTWRSTLIAFACLWSAAALAAGPHNHAPKFGGMVKEADEIQYELVAKSDTLTVYVEDHGKPMDTKGATGTVTLRAGAERTAVSLTPAGGNKLEARGAFKLAPGTVAIVQVKPAGRPEGSVRFALK